MNIRRYISHAVICAFLLLSCSSEKGEEVQITQGEGGGAKTQTEEKALLHHADYLIRIDPETGFRNTVFRLSSQNFALTDAAVQWMVNGEPIEGADDISFTPQNTQYGKGDIVQAKAVIEGREVLSNTAHLKNAPPEFTRVKLMPEVFKVGDTLYVDTSVTDVDGDEVSVSYKWKKNGEPAGEGRRIESPLKRGDRVSVAIMPFDGAEYGRQVILDRKIENLPPMIIEDTVFDFDGKTYTHRVRAEDPDGDSLSYALKSSENNITIDPESGIITWSVPKGFTGSSNVTVSVTDGQGGESTRELTFSINPSK
jgi:hypothetical protein